MTTPPRVSRRRFLAPAAALAPALLLGQRAWAQPAWPSQPIKLVVPFPPGGSSDGLGRLLADKMGPLIGGNFFVENKPGGTTQIGTELVSIAPADGYTLLLGAATSFTVLPNQRKLPFSLDDFEVIGGIADYLAVMAVRKTLPINDMKELVAYARQHPGKLSFGSAGEGSAGHVYGMTLARDNDFKVLHVPYRGSAAAVNALLGDEIDFIIDGAVNAMVKSDRARGLAVLYRKRHPDLPQLPTLQETGFKVTSPTSSGWALLAPKGTPAPVVDRLSKALQQVLQQADVQQALARSNSIAAWQTGDDFRRSVQADRRMYAELLPSIGIE